MRRCPSDVYAPGFATAVQMEGPAKAGLEDKFRPHFFDGVATVVAKLFCRTGADFAMFGEKDYQQLLVVRRMAKDLDIPIEVIGVPTVREADGLAMSSRNRYLTPRRAPPGGVLAALLAAGGREDQSGRLNPRAPPARRSRSLTTLGFKVDYVTARNAETFAFPENAG